MIKFWKVLIKIKVDIMEEHIGDIRRKMETLIKESKINSINQNTVKNKDYLW